MWTSGHGNDSNSPRLRTAAQIDPSYSPSGANSCYSQRLSVVDRRFAASRPVFEHLLWRHGDVTAAPRVIGRGGWVHLLLLLLCASRHLYSFTDADAAARSRPWLRWRRFVSLQTIIHNNNINHDDEVAGYSAARPAAGGPQQLRRSPAHSPAQCGQCHVVSWRRKLKRGV